jgi:methionyl-tRNA synthetase
MAITYDEFRKTELRVALVEEAEPVPGTSKLLKLTIKVGGEKRQIVSGIAEMYTPEQLKGKKVVIVANLEPRTIRGVESQGMVLTAEGPDKKFALLSLDRDVEDGSEIR